jgi:hypothetical protein
MTTIASPLQCSRHTVYTALTQRHVVVAEDQEQAARQEA